LTTLAEREFDAVKSPDKVPDFIYWYRGLAAAHSFQYDAAIADFRILLDRTLKQQQQDQIIHVPLADNEFRFMLADLHRLAGHNDSAIVLFQEALEHDLGLVMAHTYLASIYESTGRDADALVERQRAAELNGDDPVALFELAVSLFNAGKVRQSVEQLYRAVGLNGRYAPPRYLLGRAAEAFSQPDMAREQYTQFLALAPLRMEELRADAQLRLDKLPK
jgi:tetratricopeptide (TPR) repeat protein